ncbi:MAG: SpoIVB peptidase S55 domain-containing protein [Actinomycetota bacterium]
MSKVGGMRRTAGAVLVVAVLTGAALAPTSVGAQTATPGECPTVMPVSEVREGMVGTGYTVSKGTEPEPFSVEILGVMPDGIGPGRDLIVVDTSSPAIQEANGIWYGMSGSPVYIDDKFVGALAYGLSFGASTVAGLTPAEDMLKIAARPAEAEGFGPGMTSVSPGKATLSPAMRKNVARSTDTSVARTSSRMERLMTPLSVSGMGTRAMDHLEETLREEDQPFLAYAGASASAAAAPATEPVPGGNFAAALSYGDVTYAGIGTTSYVCEGKVLAFGHPFFYYPAGTTALGANLADAITIVSDPAYGGYKLATVGAAIGTVDQDRFAGIRSLLGASPPAIPITSTITELDGGTRDGATQVLDSEYVPYLAFSHLLSNIDFTRDEIGEGSATGTWTITGTTEDGTPWTLTRSNVFANEYDINYFAISEVEQELYTLFYNRFEEVEFTSLDFDATFEDELEQYTMTEVLVSVNGGEYKEAKRRLKVTPGSLLDYQITLTPYDGGEDRIVDLQLQVPNRTRRSPYVDIRGGMDNYYSYDYYCFSEFGDCGETGGKVDSVEELVQALQEKPKNNELIASLRVGRRILSQDSETFDQVVSGRKFTYLQVKNGPKACEGDSGSAPKKKC